MALRDGICRTGRSSSQTRMTSLDISKGKFDEQYLVRRYRDEAAGGEMTSMCAKRSGTTAVDDCN